MLVHRLLERTPRTGAGSAPRCSMAHASRPTRELDGLANRFANVLLAAGVVRHDRVVIARRELLRAGSGLSGNDQGRGGRRSATRRTQERQAGDGSGDCAPAAAVIDAADGPRDRPRSPAGARTSLFVPGRQKQARSSPRPAGSALH